MHTVKQIFLSALLALVPALALAQGTVVKGTVTDSEGLPVIGAGVFEKGTTNGVVTDIDGKFEISAKPEKVTLVFTMLGYDDLEITTGSNSRLAVTLTETALGLDETIVIGYGTSTKKDLTGAVGVVRGAELGKMSVSSANDVLQGKVAGVMVSASSGAPGRGSITRIRGIGSINGSSTPLYVVDGLPQTGIDYLNPSDIETITVHKDASAVAIYGSRAANGVILITTRSGKNNSKITVSYDAYAGVQNAAKRPYMMGASEYIQYRNLAADNAGEARLPAFANDEAIEAILNFVEKNTGSREGVDWWSEIMHKNAPIQSHSVNVSGGTDNVSFSSSVSYFSQDGIVKGTSYDRISWRNSFNAKISDRITLTGNLGIISTSSQLTDEGNPVTGTVFLAMACDPLSPVFRNDLVDIPSTLSDVYIGYEPSNPYSQYGGILFSNKRNPVAQIERMRQSTYGSLAIKGGATLKIDITRHLSLNSNFAMDLGHSYTDGFQPSYQISASDYATYNTVVENNSRSQYLVFEETLAYNNDFGKFKFGALLGASAEQTKGRTANASIQGTMNNDASMAILSAGTLNQSVSGYPYTTAMESAFARVTLNYDDRYLLAANARVDGSSKFAEGYRWGFFPSVSGAWRLSEEDFMESTRTWLSEAKLRLSYGHIGNQNISGGSYQSTYGTNIWNRYQFGDAQTVYIGSGRMFVGNGSLQWETSKQFDAGIDLGMLRNRLDVTIDYYRKKICDMLMEEPQPTTLGYPNFPYANVGSMVNSGFEFSLGWNDTVGEFSYGVNANISTLKNVVTSLGNGDAIYGTAYLANTLTKTEVGMPVGYFYGLQTNGIFQNEEQVKNSSQRKTATPGDVRYKDIDLDGDIDDDDRTMIGNPWPDFVYGLTLTAAWKGFDFSVFFQGSQGNDVMNMKMYDLESGNAYLNAPAGFIERSWHGEGTSDTYHKISNLQGNNQAVSDYFVEDGSYMRIKNLQLGYSLPKYLISAIGLTQARIYLSAQNLCTFTAYSGLDPEIGSSSSITSGIDQGYYPQARTFSVGVNLKF